jgi:HTH-type transcriptional regulator/antitoxin HigA
MKPTLAEAIKYWDHIAPLAKCPQNNKEFNKLASQLDELLLIVGNDEKHDLMGLVDLLSQLISNYENQHFPALNTKGINALKYLMEAHNLRQSDLSDIASQGVMSEILNGKRSLNLRQIKLFAKLFHVSPATFID